MSDDPEVPQVDFRLLHDAGGPASCSAAACNCLPGSVQSCLTQCGAIEGTPILQSLETFNATLQAEFVKALQLSTLANVAAHIDNISAGEHEESDLDPDTLQGCLGVLSASWPDTAYMHTCIHEAAAQSFCDCKRQVCGGLPYCGPVFLL